MLYVEQAMYFSSYCFFIINNVLFIIVIGTFDSFSRRVNFESQILSSRLRKSKSRNR